ncbi:MAG: hypothetical protein ACTH31_01100 [Pseudoclavibacter sp.]
MSTGERPLRARQGVIADAWRELGDGVAALSNGSGRPLARTVKLVLDPLVIRPVQRPHLASGALDDAAAAELRSSILTAVADLEATAAWFAVLKRVRRGLGITEGNPQDLYFQRCFELARTEGAPGASDADAVGAIARETLADVHGQRDASLLARVRAVLADTEAVADLEHVLDDAWVGAGTVSRAVSIAGVPTGVPAGPRTGVPAEARTGVPAGARTGVPAGPRSRSADGPGGATRSVGIRSVATRAAATSPAASSPAADQPVPAPDGVHASARVDAVWRALDACASARMSATGAPMGARPGSASPASPADLTVLLAELDAAAAGSHAAAAFQRPGVARSLGLTTRDVLERPELGASASKRALPRPFDRSLLQRLFAVLTSGVPIDDDADPRDVLGAEAHRASAPWQVADERSRVILLLGLEASTSLGGDAGPRAGDQPEPGDQPEAGGARDGSDAREVGRASESIAHRASETMAHRMLRARWQREAYVRRVSRLPGDASGVPARLRHDVVAIRQGYLRRLWARVHGREVRGDASEHDVWDTLDGALRSVIMDHRQRLKVAIARDAEGAVA